MMLQSPKSSEQEEEEAPPQTMSVLEKRRASYKKQLNKAAQDAAEEFVKAANGLKEGQPRSPPAKQVSKRRLQLKKNYFTSSHPHHDIYTFCYWQIFWPAGPRLPFVWQAQYTEPLDELRGPRRPFVWQAQYTCSVSCFENPRLGKIR